MKKWILISASLLLAIMIGWGSWIYYSAVSASDQIVNQLVTKAKQQYQLQHIKKVTYYHGTYPYHVIKAVNADSQTVYIWLSEKHDVSLVRRAEQGWTQEQVKKHFLVNYQPKQLIDIRLGVEDQTPVWQITFVDAKDNYTFRYIRFADGLWYQTIHL